MINVWGMTDKGLVRKENQDAYAVKRTQDSDCVISVVCDGMGGPAGGCVASHIAVDTFIEELEKILTPDMAPEQLREASAYAVSLANKAIREAAFHSEEYRDMGTTLVSAVSFADGAVITNVGDSRAYHITQDGITRVTHHLKHTRSENVSPEKFLTIFVPNLTNTDFSKFHKYFMCFF